MAPKFLSGHIINQNHKYYVIPDRAQRRSGISRLELQTVMFGYSTCTSLSWGFRIFLSLTQEIPDDEGFLFSVIESFYGVSRRFYVKGKTSVMPYDLWEDQ
ncbi:hypothetical protein QQ008_16765 [Fulvivirgaceae bacterium BMA10]|uniref:Uncharacterized protein n=1 Tax=Splendidivirga corallicola TaxID=3051826 RepID=A0ABT8KTT6_9BACT|nr:hypothetical protein [Fulvivirgaceae bacterium BMA10]